MVATVFDLAASEKLDFTFDFTAELDAAGVTIESQVVTVTPSSPALTAHSTTIASGNKKVVVVLSHAETSAGQEWNVTCSVNGTGSPDREFKQGMTIRSRPTPPLAANGLTTPARVISELGITDPAKIELVADYINEATAAISNFCGRTFHREAGIVEKVAGFGSEFLLLSKTPVESISAISFDGVTVSSSDYSIHSAGAGMIYNANGWNDTGGHSGNLSKTPVGGSRAKLYSVTYTGGYVMPGNSGRTLPYDIERACIEMVKSLVFGRRDSSVKSESVDGVYSVTYADDNRDGSSLPSNIAAMLSPYKRITL